MPANNSLNIPESIAFIRPLVARYHEICKAEPIVAYFCLMLAVQQVLDSQLHTKEPAAAEYASYLMNTLEEMKNDKDLLDNEPATVVLESDENSQEYVMRFANGVFDRAELATLTQKVTKQTAATFAAAAVFLGLEAVWSPLSGETQEKIKFSKFQAARILRAIKAGEDPNELYAIPDDEPTDLNPDQEEREVNDDQVVDDKPGSVKSEGANKDEQEQLPRNGSEEVNSSTGASASQDNVADAFSELNLPEAPKVNPESDISLPQAPRANPKNDYELPKAPQVAPEIDPEKDLSPPVQPAKPEGAPKIPHKTPVGNRNTASNSIPQSNPTSKLSSAEIMALTKSTGNAQKHAKYAISALNYDDVNTAIGELEKAIEILKYLK